MITLLLFNTKWMELTISHFPSEWLKIHIKTYAPHKNKKWKANKKIETHTKLLKRLRNVQKTWLFFSSKGMFISIRFRLFNGLVFIDINVFIYVYKYIWDGWLHHFVFLNTLCLLCCDAYFHCQHAEELCDAITEHFFFWCVLLSIWFAANDKNTSYICDPTN